MQGFISALYSLISQVCAQVKNINVFNIHIYILPVFFLNSFFLCDFPPIFRNCGNVFCASCCDQKIPVPSQQLFEPSRVCKSCFSNLETLAPSLEIELDKPITASSNWSRNRNGSSQLDEYNCRGPEGWVQRRDYLKWNRVYIRDGARGGCFALSVSVCGRDCWTYLGGRLKACLHLRWNLSCPCCIKLCKWMVQHQSFFNRISSSHEDIRFQWCSWECRTGKGASWTRPQRPSFDFEFSSLSINS